MLQVQIICCEIIQPGSTIIQILLITNTMLSTSSKARSKTRRPFTSLQSVSMVRIIDTFANICKMWRKCPKTPPEWAVTKKRHVEASLHLSSHNKGHERSTSAPNSSHWNTLLKEWDLSHVRFWAHLLMIQILLNSTAPVVVYIHLRVQNTNTSM